MFSRPSSLLGRLFILLVLPLALFLGATSLWEYLFVRDLLLAQWQENALLSVERAGGEFDARLGRLARGMQALAGSGGSPLGEKKQQWLLSRLTEMPGVSQARLVFASEPAASGSPRASRRITSVSDPAFLPAAPGLALMRSELLGPKKRLLGFLEVEVSLLSLLSDLEPAGDKHPHPLVVMDREGRCLAAYDPSRKGGPAGDFRPSGPACGVALPDTPVGTVLRAGRLQAEVTSFYRSQASPWILLRHGEGREVLGPFYRFRLFFLLSTLLSVAGILALLHLGVGPLVRDIRRLSQAAREVAQGRYRTLPVSRQDELGQLLHSFNDMVAGLEERDFIAATFGRYVDPAVAAELLRCPVAARLGGRRREVVIMMADIRGFTPLAEALSPEVLIRLLNHYFSAIIEVVHTYRGIIVDFFGDSILAFFDPLESPVPPVARRALKCALQIQGVLARVRAAHPEWPPLELGLGLHTGPVVVGNIGSETRTKYGIVGAAVNFTHRLQAQAQPGEVVISEALFLLTREAVTVTRTVTTRLKGVDQEVTLYAVEEPGLPEVEPRGDRHGA